MYFQAKGAKSFTPLFASGLHQNNPKPQVIYASDESEVASHKSKWPRLVFIRWKDSVSENQIHFNLPMHVLERNNKQHFAENAFYGHAY